MEEPAEIKALREALSFSPDNLPLHQHYIKTLMKYGRYEAAAVAAREALQMEAGHAEIELLLAQSYVQLGKRNEAFVILENQEEKGTLSFEAKLTYAKLLSETTELVKAARLYKELKAGKEDFTDDTLEEELAAFLIDESEVDRASGRQRLKAGDHPGTIELEREKPRISFQDVGGMDQVKDDIRMKIIHPLQNAELFKAYGKSVGGGILLYGPPGCGKTYIARATAGEVKANFFTIGLHDVLDMWIGQSEKNLHEIFQQARRASPSVLFIDEVDALGASRKDMRHSASRTTINQFLSELDGVENSNDGVLVLGATNAPWHLDHALRRPGRFDQIIFVPPPDESARAAILQVLLKNKPAEDIDFKSLARKTRDFSGADLKALIDQAVERKLEEAMKMGGLIPLRNKDLEKAAKRIKPSTREWFASAKNYAVYANQAGLYDDILEYLKIKKF